MSTLFLNLSIVLSMFMMLSHPLLLVILLIGLTLINMMFLLLYFNSSWILMVLFLVFLGGLLVIFTYLSALVPNEIYFYKIAWMMIIMSPAFMNMFESSEKAVNQTLLISTSINMNETSSVLFFVVYLLTALMVSMMMTQQMKGPLQQNSY